MKEYSAERHVFEIPELRREILSYIVEPNKVTYNPRSKTCTDDIKLNCCCFVYMCCFCRCFIVYDILHMMVKGPRHR